jgi:acyl transferase domain-containing protein
MQALPAGGAMLAVSAAVGEVAAAVAEWSGRVSVAAVNAPRSVVVSGDVEVVDVLARRWEAEGLQTARLRVSHAFHSPRMEAMLGEFEQVAASLTYAPPRVPMVSTLTGALVDADEVCTPGYWVRQARETVRFADAVGWLHGQGVDTFVELGGRPTLGPAIGECVDGDAGVLATAVLHHRTDEPTALLTALARLHVHGVDIDWAAVFTGSRARLVDLPTQAFQHRRYWLSHQRSGAVGDGHPLAASVVRLADGGVVVTGSVSAGSPEWTADHVVVG